MVGFPLLLIPLALYNIIVLLMPSVSLAEPLFSLTLVSGEMWHVTLGDILLALGIVLLLLEVIKGARPGAKYLTDHLLSFVVFACAAAEFVLWRKFASSTFFLLTLLALADFLSGIALRVRRSAQFAPPGVPSRRAARRVETKAAEPRFEPQRPALSPEPRAQPVAPVQADPPAAAPPQSAAAIAEAVLLDRPGPRPVQFPAASVEASSQLTSPELQPNGHSPPSPKASEH